MYFTDEKDYIMRMIKEMVRILFSLIYGKKYVSVELEKENKYEVSGKNLKSFLDMIDSGQINEAAIFVHGCFWHRHEGCKYAYMPRSRVEFWQKKFDANIKRDECVRKELMRKKVKVVIVWECTIKKMKKDEEFREDKLHQLEDYLQNEQYSLEI